jgi:hypothetical protein
MALHLAVSSELGRLCLRLNLVATVRHRLETWLACTVELTVHPERADSPRTLNGPISRGRALAAEGRTAHTDLTRRLSAERLDRPPVPRLHCALADATEPCT